MDIKVKYVIEEEGSLPSRDIATYEEAVKEYNDLIKEDKEVYGLSDAEIRYKIMKYTEVGERTYRRDLTPPLKACGERLFLICYKNGNTLKTHAYDMELEDGIVYQTCRATWNDAPRMSVFDGSKIDKIVCLDE